MWTHSGQQKGLLVGTGMLTVGETSWLVATERGRPSAVQVGRRARGRDSASTKTTDAWLGVKINNGRRATEETSLVVATQHNEADE